MTLDLERELIRDDGRRPLRAVLRGLLQTAAIVFPISIFFGLPAYVPGKHPSFAAYVSALLPLLVWPTLAVPAILHAWYEEPLVGRVFVFGTVRGRTPPNLIAISGATFIGFSMTYLLFRWMPWTSIPG